MKTKTLWGIYDGEPFMENPALGILGLGTNPKRKRKRGVKMAVRRRKRTTRRRGRKHAAPRRRSRTVAVAVANPRRRRRRSNRRRNWAMPGIVAAANPRRRRSRRRSNPRHHRRHRRSNPGFLGFGLPPVKSVVFAGIGFAGPSLVSGFLTSTFPTVMQQTTSLGVAGKYLVKIGSVLGLSWLAKRFVGQNEGNMVMIGGGANIALSLVNDFAPGFLPANPLGMYLPTVFPTMQQQASMRAYVPLRGLNAALPSRMPTAASFPTGSFVAGRTGAYGGTAARFKRF